MKHTQETKNKLREMRLGDKNPMWRGDKVGMTALHEWVKNRLPKPKLCQCCNGKPAIDLANISGKYKRDLTDWEYLCRRCHMVKDGRINNLKLGRDALAKNGGWCKGLTKDTNMSVKEMSNKKLAELNPNWKGGTKRYWKEKLKKERG